MISFVKKPLNEQYEYQNTTITEYKIQKGDTLWDISRKFSNNNHEEFIYLIKKLNNLEDSVLFENQILVIPQNI